MISLWFALVTEIDRLCNSNYFEFYSLFTGWLSLKLSCLIFPIKGILAGCFECNITPLDLNDCAS